MDTFSIHVKLHAFPVSLIPEPVELSVLKLHQTFFIQIFVLRISLFPEGTDTIFQSPHKRLHIRRIPFFGRMGFVRHIYLFRHTAAVYAKTDFLSFLRIDLNIKSSACDFLFSKYGKYPFRIHPIKLFGFFTLFLIRRKDTEYTVFFLDSPHQFMADPNRPAIP